MTLAIDKKKYWRDYFDQRANAPLNDYQRVGYSSAGNAQFMHATLADLLGHPEGKDILDIGCGDGQVSDRWTDQNQVVGCDFSPAMVAAASRRGLKPIAADASHLPFADGTFDIVLCVEMLTCLPDPISAIGEISRLVKPGGLLVVSGLNRRSWLRRCIRRVATTMGHTQPVLLDVGKLSKALAASGSVPNQLIWVGYLPRFRNYRVVGDHGWQAAWATNFVITSVRN